MSMNTQLAPVEMNGRPLGVSPMPIPTKERLVPLATMIAPVMPFRSRDQILRDFPTELGALNTAADEIASFLSAAVASNFRKKNLRHPVQGPKVEFRRPILAFPLADLVSQDDIRLFKGLNEKLYQASLMVVEETYSFLERCRTASVFGTIDYPSEGVARYTGHLYTVEDSVSTRVYSDRTEYDTTRSLRHRFSYKELRAAHWHSIRDRSVPRSPEVDELLGKVPRVLEEPLKIVNGIEVFHLFADREMISETRTDVWHHPVIENVYHRDPALVLFDYVLTAW